MKKITLPYSKVRADFDENPMRTSSCDYTTAQVTLIGGSGTLKVPIPFIAITGADYTVDGLTSGLVLRVGDEVTLTVILYKGELNIPEFGYVVDNEQSTGSYEENVSDGIITITGECTITLNQILT